MIDPGLIVEHMDIVGSDGEHIGTVDRTLGGTVKLVHYSARNGQFHHLPVEWFCMVRDGKLWLDRRRAEAIHFWHPEIVDPDREAEV